MSRVLCFTQPKKDPEKCCLKKLVPCLRWILYLPLYVCIDTQNENKGNGLHFLYRFSFPSPASLFTHGRKLGNLTWSTVFGLLTYQALNCLQGLFQSDWGGCTGCSPWELSRSFKRCVSSPLLCHWSEPWGVSWRGSGVLFVAWPRSGLLLLLAQLHRSSAMW